MKVEYTYRIALWFCLTCVCIMGGGCGSPYKADYETTHDFSKYESYAWLEPNEPMMDALAANPLLKRRVVAAVDKVLQERYTLSDSNEPDFFVYTHGTVKERMRVDDSLSMGAGYYGRYGAMGVRHVDVRYYEEGTVVVDVIDPEKDELVWRGWVTQTVRDYKDPRQAEAVIEKAVRGILGNFPPTAK